VDFSFTDEQRRIDAPSTKVYSPKKGTTGRAGADASDRSRSRGTLGAEAANKKHEPAPVTVASRIGIIFCGFLLAGMILFTLTGYERITRAYADINTINRAIEATQLRIKALDVQIECAVTIQDAQETAERYGMHYPVQSQYQRIGGPIHISGSAPSDNGQDDMALPDDPEPVTEPDALPEGNLANH